MKLVKSLLLGSAAGFAVVAGAQAADLPIRKAEPVAVEYVRVCSAYGAGYFYVPGTDTCLKIGGHVMAEALYVEPFDRADNAFGIRARARLSVDLRTPTEYGLLRSFFEMEGNRNPIATAGQPPLATSANNFSVRRAFVQFGGLTAGRLESFFSNASLPSFNYGTLRFDDATKVNTIGYTFAFGGGFSATIAIEDGIDRRFNEFAAFGAPVNFAPVVYAGQRAPDVVGNLKYEGTWGTAQLSGAIHQVRSDNLVVFPNGVAEFPDTEYGFAVGATAGLNLPFFGPSDSAWISAIYADGALAYLSGGNSTIGGTDPLSPLAARLGFVDAVVGPNGDLKTSQAWAIAGGIRHFFTPTISAGLQGSYLSVDYGRQFSTFTPGTGFVTGLSDFTEYRIGGQVVWTPVRGLDIGVEVIYAHTDANDRIFIPALNRSFSSEGATEGRIRIQRSF
jgi:hypothetical protein